MSCQPCPRRATLLTDRVGMTLVEVLIVALIIGILSGMTASKLDWGRYRADSVSRGVVAELVVAQRLAVTLQANVRVTVETTRMVIHEDANNDNLVNGDERVRSVPLDYDYQFEQGSAADLPAPAEPSVIATVVFRRDGSASRSGTLYISGPGNDPTCRHCRAASITRSTGRVTWYSYATGTWRGGH